LTFDMDTSYNIYTNKKLAEMIYQKLIRFMDGSFKKPVIMTAESFTGGAISAALVSVAGISEFFKGSVVAYDNSIKVSLAGVNVETLNRHGAVSAETVAEMASCLKKRYGADIAIATSGVAGPGGGSIEKPIGTAWFGFDFFGDAYNVKKKFNGSRSDITRKGVEFVLRETLRALRRFEEKSKSVF